MSQPMRILLSLIVGLTAGVIAARTAPGFAGIAASIAEPIGGLWVSGLQMTIIPLVVSLLITGIAASAEAARTSRLAARALLLFIILLWTSSALGMALTLGLLDLWPMGADSAEALRGALAAGGETAQAPGFADFLKSVLPTNPIAAAANDSILPLILFTCLFAFAMTQLPDEPRLTLVNFFRAVEKAMLVMVNWVLWLAPIGVTALAFVVGARAGAAAFGALLHYVLIVSAVGFIVSLLAYAVAVVGGRVPLGRFARAVLPAQVVAISTQSSLASLPAMLKSAEALDIPVRASGVVLPMAVALFRMTGPVMNLAVAVYIAHWFGVELSASQIIAGIAVAAITTMGAAGVPGQATFITSIAPICIAMGAPIAPLALLVAVETIPDIIRTWGNVTMDVAATAAVSRRSGFYADEMTAEDRLLAGEEPEAAEAARA